MPEYRNVIISLSHIFLQLGRAKIKIACSQVSSVYDLPRPAPSDEEEMNALVPSQEVAAPVALAVDASQQSVSQPASAPAPALSSSPSPAPALSSSPPPAPAPSSSPPRAPAAAQQEKEAADNSSDSEDNSSDSEDSGDSESEDNEDVTEKNVEKRGEKRKAENPTQAIPTEIADETDFDPQSLVTGASRLLRSSKRRRGEETTEDKEEQRVNSGETAAFR